MILEDIYNLTSKYVEQVPKSKRKSIGQFFTAFSTAEFMGKLIYCNKKNISILDAGAGTGLLATAVLQNLLENQNSQTISIDFYENNEDIIPVLKSSIAMLENFAALKNKRIKSRIINENFIVHNGEAWNSQCDEGIYDIVISNPPYKKISKSNEEATIMSDIVFGQPNIYSLFMAMSVKLLKSQGELVYIVPRSWTSGLYFSSFRRYFFSFMQVTHLHLFLSRSNLFHEDNVLQETMIIKATKSTSKQNSVTITSCTGNNDFNNISTFSVPYDTCIGSGNKYFMYLPTSQDDVDILDTVNSFSDTLESLGFKLKTGLTVDFRSKKWMRNLEVHDTVPLFWACNCSNSRITFPVLQAENQYITTENSSLLMKNTNYVFLKRFSSKEESRRLQPSIFLKSDLPQYPFISTENHLNFITRCNGEMSDNEVFGLYVIFASTLYDRYFRILSGSTQVNATEINVIPIPDLDDIRLVGLRSKLFSHLTTQICDSLLEDLIDEKRRCKEASSKPRHAIEAAS